MALREFIVEADVVVYLDPRTRIPFPGERATTQCPPLPPSTLVPIPAA